MNNIRKTTIPKPKNICLSRLTHSAHFQRFNPFLPYEYKRQLGPSSSLRQLHHKFVEFCRVTPSCHMAFEAYLWSIPNFTSASTKQASRRSASGCHGHKVRSNLDRITCNFLADTNNADLRAVLVTSFVFELKKPPSSVLEPRTLLGVLTFPESIPDLRAKTCEV